MSIELSPSLRGFALQIALQLPDDQREAISVLRYAREIVEHGPEKLGHAVRTSDIGVVRRGKALSSSESGPGVIRPASAFLFSAF